MTTYVDLASLGPDDDIAEHRARLLGLSGTLVPRELRDRLLSLTEGTVICGAHAINDWRILPSTVGLVCIEDPSANDPLPMRFTDVREWRLVCAGLSRTAAHNIVAKPPKTMRHKFWHTYQATSTPWEPPPTIEIEQLATIEAKQASLVEQPFTVTLVNNEETLTRFLQCMMGASILGVDVETDVAEAEPNEMRDTLVGVGVAIDNDTFFGYESYQPWMVALRNCLANVPWIGSNSKYDLCCLRRAGITPGPLVGDGMLAAYLRGEPSARLKDLVLRRLGVRMTTYDEIVGIGKKKIPISQADEKIVSTYCCADAYYGVQIERLLESELDDKTRRLYHKVDIPLVTILADMQFIGIGYDRVEGRKMLEETKAQQLFCAEEINTLITIEEDNSADIKKDKG